MARVAVRLGHTCAGPGELGGHSYLLALTMDEAPTCSREWPRQSQRRYRGQERERCGENRRGKLRKPESHRMRQGLGTKGGPASLPPTQLRGTTLPHNPRARRLEPASHHLAPAQASEPSGKRKGQLEYKVEFAFFSFPTCLGHKNASLINWEENEKHTAHSGFGRGRNRERNSSDSVGPTPAAGAAPSHGSTPGGTPWH